MPERAHGFRVYGWQVDVATHALCEWDGTPGDGAPTESHWLKRRAEVVRVLNEVGFEVAEPAPDADAPDQWVLVGGMGGFVCAGCGDPVESEPCREHQPRAYAGPIEGEMTDA